MARWACERPRSSSRNCSPGHGQLTASQATSSQPARQPAHSVLTASQVATQAGPHHTPPMHPGAAPPGARHLLLGLELFLKLADLKLHACGAGMQGEGMAGHGLGRWLPCEPYPYGRAWAGGHGKHGGA